MKRKKLTTPAMKEAFGSSFEAAMTGRELEQALPARKQYGNLGLKDRLSLLRRRLEKLIEEAAFVVDAIDNTTSKL